MTRHDDDALGSLRSELRELEERVETLAGPVLQGEDVGNGVRAGEQRLLVARRDEARAAVERLRSCKREEWRSTFRAAETSVRTLFHAVWFVEHRRGETFGDTTGSHVMRPTHLLARSLARRHGG